MRLQYAVICHEFEDGEWDGVTNLHAVRHKLFVSFPEAGLANTAGDPEAPKPPIPIKLVISLIDGEPGLHTILVSIRRPTGTLLNRIPSLVIDWDEASPTFFVIFDIKFQVFENGTYDFRILADGDPMGTVPLPVQVVAAPS